MFFCPLLFLKIHIIHKGACNGEDSASSMDNIGAATDQHLQRVEGVVQPGSPDGGQNDVHDLTFSTTNKDCLNCSCVPVTNGANVGPGLNDGIYTTLYIY